MWLPERDTTFKQFLYLVTTRRGITDSEVADTLGVTQRWVRELRRRHREQ